MESKEDKTIYRASSDFKTLRGRAILKGILDEVNVFKEDEEVVNFNYKELEKRLSNKNNTYDIKINFD